VAPFVSDKISISDSWCPSSALDIRCIGLAGFDVRDREQGHA
jgi:hypothetical protein